MITMGYVCNPASAHFLNVINQRPAPQKGNLCFTGIIDVGYLELKHHQWLLWVQSPWGRIFWEVFPQGQLWSRREEDCLSSWYLNLVVCKSLPHGTGSEGTKSDVTESSLALWGAVDENAALVALETPVLEEDHQRQWPVWVELTCAYETSWVCSRWRSQRSRMRQVKTTSLREVSRCGNTELFMCSEFAFA